MTTMLINSYDDNDTEDFNNDDQENRGNDDGEFHNDERSTKSW